LGRKFPDPEVADPTQSEKNYPTQPGLKFFDSDLSGLQTDGMSSFFFEIGQVNFAKKK